MSAASASSADNHDLEYEHPEDEVNQLASQFAKARIIENVASTYANVPTTKKFAKPYNRPSKKNSSSVTPVQRRYLPTSSIQMGTVMPAMPHQGNRNNGNANGGRRSRRKSHHKRKSHHRKTHHKRK